MNAEQPTHPERHTEQRAQGLRGAGLFLAVLAFFGARIVQSLKDGTVPKPRAAVTAPTRAPDAAQIGAVRSMFIDPLWKKGDEQSCRRAVALAKDLASKFPGAGESLELLAESYSKLGDFFEESDRIEKAADEYRKALEVHQKLLADFAQDALRRGCLFSLAMDHLQLGDQARAREWYDKAVEWMEKNRPSDQNLKRLRAQVEALMEATDHAESKDAGSVDWVDESAPDGANDESLRGRRGRTGHERRAADGPGAEARPSGHQAR